MQIRVVESVLKANDAVAQENRRRLDQASVLAVNLMSAPGSGKTTLLEKTIPALGPENCAVLVGDLQTTRDAERLDAAGARTVQINTGKGCHLSATQIAQGLDQIPLTKTRYLFIENVGNMVCPTGVDLGAHRRIALLSIPEGDDKVAKYPTLLQAAHLILLTKVDLLNVLDFDRRRVHDDLDRMNTGAPRIELSAHTGIGLQTWTQWLQQQNQKT